MTEHGPMAVEDLNIKHIFQAKPTKTIGAQNIPQYIDQKGLIQIKNPPSSNIAMDSQVTMQRNIGDRECSQTVTVRSEISNEDIQIQHANSKITEFYDANEKS